MTHNTEDLVNAAFKKAAAKQPEPRPALEWIDMENWDAESRPKTALACPRQDSTVPTDIVKRRRINRQKSVDLASTRINSIRTRLAWFLTRARTILVSRIREHFNVSYADLIAAGFRLKSLYDEDAILGAPNRNGIIEPTELYNQIYEQAGDVKPKCIAFDASADVYAGNEIDRSQTRQFVGLLRKLASACQGSVILLSHPSLTGISSGSGLSGSTAW